jgi:hypothetical protein
MADLTHHFLGGIAKYREASATSTDERDEIGTCRTIDISLEYLQEL